MAHFNAAHTMREIGQQSEEFAARSKLVPVSAAVVAVLAALATLFANHSSVSALAQKNEAILYQSKATDQYNYYQAKKIKAELAQAFLDNGGMTAAARSDTQARMNRENAEALPVLTKAQSLDAQSDAHFTQSEKYLGSYESFEVGATLFEVSVVLISITALMRSPALLALAAGATLVGLGFFFAGVFH